MVDADVARSAISATGLALALSQGCLAPSGDAAKTESRSQTIPNPEL